MKLAQLQEARHYGSKDTKEQWQRFFWFNRNGWNYRSDSLPGLWLENLKPRLYADSWSSKKPPKNPNFVFVFTVQGDAELQATKPYKCPKCGARPHQPCTTPNGRPAKRAHEARVYQWNRAGRKPTRITKQLSDIAYRWVQDTLDQNHLRPLKIVKEDPNLIMAGRGGGNKRSQMVIPIAVYVPQMNWGYKDFYADRSMEYGSNR